MGSYEEDAFDAARAAAWEAFTKGVEPYQKAYDEAMAAALAEYNAATGSAEEEPQALVELYGDESPEEE